MDPPILNGLAQPLSWGCAGSHDHIYSNQLQPESRGYLLLWSLLFPRLMEGVSLEWVHSSWCLPMEAKRAHEKNISFQGSVWAPYVLDDCSWFPCHSPWNSFPYLTPCLGFCICKMGAMVVLLIYLLVHLWGWAYSGVMCRWISSVSAMWTGRIVHWLKKSCTCSIRQLHTNHN